MKLILVIGKSPDIMIHINALKSISNLNTYNSFTPKCLQYEINSLDKCTINKYNILVLLDKSINDSLNELILTDTLVGDIFTLSKLEIHNKNIKIHNTLKISQMTKIIVPKIKNIRTEEPIVKSKSITPMIKNHLHKFSELCLNMLPNMTDVKLKDISSDSLYESVFIEFRQLPHCECIIKNCVDKLDNSWSHTIVCGNDNYDYMLTMRDKINANIKIIKLDLKNVTHNDYNNLLLTKHFWTNFVGEKILLYQSDSFIFKTNISDFLEWDYIGAPFSKKQLLSIHQVGNGGLSLRSKSKMIEILDNVNLTDNVYSRVVNKYKNICKSLDNYPEDIVFSQNIQTLNIGKVPDYETATKFACDSIYTDDSFGMHCMWNGCKNWEEVFCSKNSDIFVLKIQNITDTSKLDNELDTKLDSEIDSEIDTELLIDYISETNYEKIINKGTKHLMDKNIVNLFDIDINFIKQCYNLLDYTSENIISYVKNNNYINHIFHPKQLYNLFNNEIKLLVNKKTKLIYINYKNTYYKVDDFFKYIDLYDYDKFKYTCIKEICSNNFTENKLLLLIYIGSEININIIIEKIKKYNTIENFAIAFCVNYRIIDIVIPLLKICFSENYIIYSCNELGNDIVPSLLLYDEIINNKKYSFDYVIKIHSKSDKTFLCEAIDYLFNFNLNNLLLKKNEKSSTIGFKYINIKNDVFNKLLVSKYGDLLKHNEFVHGTIFLAKKYVMDNVLLFLKNNYKIIFFQNMYDNNFLNKDYSYIHFMERLFGYV